MRQKLILNNKLRKIINLNQNNVNEMAKKSQQSQVLTIWIM